MPRFLFQLIILSLALNQFALASPKPRPAMLRLTAEEITLPGNEKTGLLGGSYLVHLNRYLYAGFGIYGSVTGQRGGFFTGGMETGIKKRLGRQLELDAGIFIGGGGGGGAPQGGGLMLRPHIGMSYLTPVGKIGLQYSQIKFPNGSINSTQASVVFEKPLSLLISGDWGKTSRVSSVDDNYLGKNRPASQDFSLLIQNYDLPAGTRNTRGQVQDADMSLVGVEWDTYFHKNTFLRLQALGAMRGNSDGYASILLGLGYDYQLPGQNNLKLAVSLGASGGGNVDTGGGFIADTSLNLQHRFNNGLLLGLKAGFQNAPDGDFEATSLGIYIGHSDRPPKKPNPGGLNIKPRHWRIRATHQTYLPKGDTRRKSQTTPDNRNINLFGLQADIMVNRNIYLTGQAIGAYDGGAGGYAAGLIGTGIIFPLHKKNRLVLNAEVLAGAAGGGGLAIGDGLVTQAMIGIGYRTSRSTSLRASYGMFKSINGTFEANVINLSFALRLTTLTWK